MMFRSVCPKPSFRPTPTSTGPDPVFAQSGHSMAIVWPADWLLRGSILEMFVKLPEQPSLYIQSFVRIQWMEDQLLKCEDWPGECLQFHPRHWHIDAEYWESLPKSGWCTAPRTAMTSNSTQPTQCAKRESSLIYMYAVAFLRCMKLPRGGDIKSGRATFPRITLCEGTPGAMNSGFKPRNALQKARSARFSSKFKHLSITQQVTVHAIVPRALHVREISVVYFLFLFMQLTSSPSFQRITHRRSKFQQWVRSRQEHPALSGYFHNVLAKV